MVGKTFTKQDLLSTTMHHIEDYKTLKAIGVVTNFVHYSLNAPVDETDHYLKCLRGYALEASFLNVSDMYDLNSDQILDIRNDRLEFIKQESQRIVLCKEDQNLYRVLPLSVKGFTVQLYNLRLANICFAVYPEEFESDKYIINTPWNKRGLWDGYARTLYKTDDMPKEISRDSHKSFLNLMYYANSLGVLKGLYDPSGYWEKMNNLQVRTTKHSSEFINSPFCVN